METENSPKQISEREATVLPSQTVSNSTDVQIENGPTPVSEPKLDKSASEPMEVNAEATNVGAETTSVEVESTNSKVEPKTNQEAVVENGCMDTSTSSPTESEHPKNKQPAIPVWEALTKDCFSFNTKVKLGDFIELQQGEKVQVRCIPAFSFPAYFRLHANIPRKDSSKLLSLCLVIELCMDAVDQFMQPNDLTKHSSTPCWFQTDQLSARVFGMTVPGSTFVDRPGLAVPCF